MCAFIVPSNETSQVASFNAQKSERIAPMMAYYCAPIAIFQVLLSWIYWGELLMWVIRKFY
jgi:hypothetical protein